MVLTKEELQIIINILKQVSVPLESGQTDKLRALLEKLKQMANDAITT